MASTTDDTPEPGNSDDMDDARGTTDESDAVFEADDGAADEDGETDEDGEESSDDADSDDADTDDADEGHVGLAELLEREGEIAADYLEGLLDIIDADGDIDMDVERDRALVSVVGAELRHLVGRGGMVLDALQELTRLAVTRETGARTRLMLDIGGYRARRRAELSELGRKAADQAAETGEPVRLNPMTSFERKVVHDAVAAAGLRSESEGVEPERRVVVLPDAARAGRPAASAVVAQENNDAPEE